MDILPAQLDHARPLADLIRQVWPYERPDITQIGRLLLHPNHAVHVAVAPGASAGESGGFVSSFVVPEGDGRRRWQIDLLAVRAGRRGQGLGRRLIAAAAAEGTVRGLRRAQALISLDNGPSHRAFAAAGFAADPRPQQLWLWRGGSLPNFCRRFRPVAVDTLTYSGVWLEPGTWAEPATVPFLASILIPDGQFDLAVDARESGFNLAGRYQTWHKTLT